MRLATRGFGQRGTRSRVIAEARPRGRLEVVGLEALVVETLGVLGLAIASAGSIARASRPRSGSGRPARPFPREPRRPAQQGHRRRRSPRRPFRRASARSSPWADEHGGRAERDAGETGNQMEPVHARVHQPDDAASPPLLRRARAPAGRSRPRALAVRNPALSQPGMTASRSPPTIPSSPRVCSSRLCGWRMFSLVRRSRK